MSDFIIGELHYLDLASMALMYLLSVFPRLVGHLDMVRFLLEAGADQEHKTDEMHTALMEACMVSFYSGARGTAAHVALMTALIPHSFYSVFLRSCALLLAI